MDTRNVGALVVYQSKLWLGGTKCSNAQIFFKWFCYVSKTINLGGTKCSNRSYDRNCDL